MKDGFIKAAVFSPKLKIADTDYNKNEIINAIIEADNNNVKILAFPELCITGYSCGDLFFQDILIENARKAVFDIAERTKALDMLIILGCPVKDKGKLYNCAIAINKGRIICIYSKQNLPNYNEYYEKRYFSTLSEDSFLKEWGTTLTNNAVLQCSTLPQLIIGIEICEDLWAVNPPSNTFALNGANVIVNISASNEFISKPTKRSEYVKNQSSRLICAYIYANAGQYESTQDLIFSGHSIIAENGSIIAEKPPFDNKMLITEIDYQKINFERSKNTGFIIKNTNYNNTFSLNIERTLLTRFISPTPFIPIDKAELEKRCEFILNMQAYALKKRLIHTGVKRLVLGLSGGLDSTLALIVCIKTMQLMDLPLTNILAISMPCFGTSTRTKSNASELASITKVTFKEIDISKAVKQHMKDIELDNSDRSAAYENAQARERTQVLMDYSNSQNALVVGTGDLSELALGWCTYNGDHMSMYSVNSSVPKTLISHILIYYAKIQNDEKLKNIVKDIIDTPVSPELLPAENDKIVQKTEDLIGPYVMHDFFLYYSIRYGFPPKKVYRLACYAFKNNFNEETILKWLKNFYKRFFSQQFKRSCLPDGVKIGSIALSPRGDWRMPSDASANQWIEQLDNL